MIKFVSEVCITAIIHPSPTSLPSASARPIPSRPLLPSRRTQPLSKQIRRARFYAPSSAHPLFYGTEDGKSYPDFECMRRHKRLARAGLAAP